MSDEPSSSSFRPGVRSLVGSAADVEEGQASERSSLCEVLYSGSDSDTPRHRRRGRFRDESDEESSRISDRDVPLGEDTIITEERLQRRARRSNRSVLRSIFQTSPPYFGYLGNKGSSRSRIADVVPSLLETEEREGRFLDGVAYHTTIPRRYRELEEARTALHLDGIWDRFPRSPRVVDRVVIPSILFR